MDLPQPGRPEHLLSRTSTQRSLEKSHAARPCGYGLNYLNYFARCAALACDPPCRAASRASPRRETRSAAPEVPSTEGLPETGKRLLFPTDRSLGARQPDTFVTRINIDPDGADASLARLHRQWNAGSFPLPIPPQCPLRLLRLEEFVG